MLHQIPCKTGARTNPMRKQDLIRHNDKNCTCMSHMELVLCFALAFNTPFYGVTFRVILPGKIPPCKSLLNLRYANTLTPASGLTGPYYYQGRGVLPYLSLLLPHLSLCRKCYTTWPGGVTVVTLP